MNSNIGGIMPAILLPDSRPSTYDLLKDDYAPLIGFPEAAEISNNHESTWYKWLKDGTLPVPSFSIGSCRRIRLIDLCNYIDAQASASTTTGKAQAEAPKKRAGRRQRVDPAVLSRA